MQFTAAFAALVLLLPGALAYTVTVYSAPIEGCSPPTTGNYLSLSAVGTESSGCITFETFQSFHTDYTTCAMYTYSDTACADYEQEFTAPQNTCQSDIGFSLNSFQIIC